MYINLKTCALQYIQILLMSIFSDWWMVKASDCNALPANNVEADKMRYAAIRTP